MRKYVAPLLGFIALCLMAFGGGNVLRQKMYPDEYLGKNEFLESIGRYIKGALRDSTYYSADAKDLRLVEYGSQVYTAQCSRCHGVKLQGQPDWKTRNPDGVLPAPPHDSTGHTWHHSDQLLFDYTKSGGQALMPQGVKSGMPAFGAVLNDDDVWAVLAYIKSTWPPEIQKRQAQQNPK